MGDCDECRRGLLRAGIAGAVLLVPGCGSGSDPGSPGDGGGADEAGDDGGEGEGGDGGACGTTCATGAKTLEFTFEKYPQLRNVGGSAGAKAPGYSDPTCKLSVVVVVQPTAGTYVAFSAGCTHQCCTVAYDEPAKEFKCPCHQSTFSVTTGERTSGPAPVGSSLEKLSVCADECGVYVSYP